MSLVSVWNGVSSVERWKLIDINNVVVVSFAILLFFLSFLFYLDTLTLKLHLIVVDFITLYYCWWQINCSATTMTTTITGCWHLVVAVVGFFIMINYAHQL